MVDSFRGFTPATLVGFFLGMACGAVLLTWVYNGTAGSVLLVALWHITYNMTSATEAAKGTVAAVVSTMVMLWAIALIVLELTAARRGKPSPMHLRELPAPRPYYVRNRTVNVAVRALLASPLHRLLSGSVLLLTYNGISSGRPHTLPVQYTRDGNCLTVLVGDSANKHWLRSLRQPMPVQVRLAGVEVSAIGEVVVDPDQRAKLLTSYQRRYPRAQRTASSAQVLCITPSSEPLREDRHISDGQSAHGAELHLGAFLGACGRDHLATCEAGAARVYRPTSQEFRQ